MRPSYSLLLLGFRSFELIDRDISLLDLEFMLPINSRDELTGVAKNATSSYGFLFERVEEMRSKANSGFSL